MLLALLTATALQATSTAAIARTVVVRTPTLEAARVEYAPGTTEPPGNHGYDVVLVPVDAGMTAEVDGVPAQWAPGIPVLISRGAPHVIENRSPHRVRFIEVRTIGDNPAGNDRVASASGATIVRSAYDKYVRATVWRLEPGARVEWRDDVDAVIVRAQAPGDATAARTLQETDDEIEVVRISRMAAAR